MRWQSTTLKTLLVLITTLVTPGLSTVTTPVAAAQVVAQSQADQGERAARLFQDAFQKVEANEFAAALPLLQQSLAIYQDLGDTLKSTLVSLLMGHTYIGLGKPELAKPVFEQALAWAQESKDTKLIEFAQEGLQLVENTAVELGQTHLIQPKP